MATIDDAILLAVDHHRAGRLAEAEGIYRQVLAQVPRHADAWQLLGALAYQSGRHEQAIEWISRAIDLCGTIAAYHSNLAEAYRAAGQFDAAEQAARRALALDPRCTAAHNNLALALQAMGRMSEARQHYDAALAIEPDSCDALNNRGLLLYELGQRRAALADYQAALRSRPDFAEAHNNLGFLLQEDGQFGAARMCYEAALRLRPGYVGALGNHGLLLLAQGEADAAAAQFDRALQLGPDDEAALTNRLLCEQYRDGATLAGLARLHAVWELRHGKPAREFWRPHANSHELNRPLRVGFVSADFGHHPAGLLALPVIEGLDRQSFTVVCYSNRHATDDVTQRLRGAAAEWRDIAGLSDERADALIRADKIDILFDLSGHTSSNRLKLFARKPAPVQASWLGYPSTTGLTAIDYLFTDDVMAASGIDEYFSERLVRLPEAAACYQLPESLPPLGPPPASRRGYVTLGSFNNPAKLAPRTIEAWSAVLRRLTDARLVLKFRGLDDPELQSCLLERFARFGVDRQRLELRGYSPLGEMLAQYNDLDLALDSFPYTGGTTTILALAMGVPVLTLPGETLSSRQSLSMLNSVGLDAFAARDPEQFVELAVDWSDRLDELAALRAVLRERLRASAWCNRERFVPQFSRVLRELWQRWAQSESGDRAN